LGQKTHPYGFRLGYNKPWRSRWFAGRDYADLLYEDVMLRRQLKDRLRSAGISAIDIERAANKLVIRIYTARPGIIIGRKGADIDFGTAEAHTSYGLIGVKCWVYQGEKVPTLGTKREPHAGIAAA